MAGDITQIVDSISATPTVLFDLNDENPCGNAVFSAPPPQLVRVGVQTQQQDGSTEASSRYGDRLIDLDLDLFAATQDLNATSIQKLGRLLSDPRGQWLKWQPVGATNPVFFRTKRADITSIVNLLATGARQLHLTIPAEPFAYGLPESGSATITNDPTAGTNPMSFVFPTVKGDVASPLSLSLTGSAFGRLLVASCASPSAPSAPLIAQVAAAHSAPAGWTYTSAVVDANAIGGHAESLVKTSGSLSPTMDFSIVAPPGDYRVLVRCGSTAFGATLTVGPTPTGLVVPTPFTQVIGGAYVYKDFGVFRLPISVPAPTPPNIITPTGVAASIRITAAIPASTGTVLVDDIMLIPVGLDDGVAASLLRGHSVDSGTKTQIDSLTEVVWSGDSSGLIDLLSVVGSGFPSVVPGVKNVLTVVREIDSLDASLGATYNAAWLYYPQYLYVRPATT